VKFWQNAKKKRKENKGIFYHCISFYLEENCQISSFWEEKLFATFGLRL
jgi:hypothetical protein